MLCGYTGVHESVQHPCGILSLCRDELIVHVGSAADEFLQECRLQELLEELIGVLNLTAHLLDDPRQEVSGIGCDSFITLVVEHVAHRRKESPNLQMRPEGHLLRKLILGAEHQEGDHKVCNRRVVKQLEQLLHHLGLVAIVPQRLLISEYHEPVQYLS